MSLSRRHENRHTKGVTMNRITLAEKLHRILSDRDPYGVGREYDTESEAVAAAQKWLEDPYQVIDELLDMIEEDTI